MDFEEQELILQVSRGDEHAFSKLFHRYHRHLGAFIYKMTGSYELTEEVIQDVFLKIWLNKEQLKTVSHFKSYLFTASKNHTINYLKQEVRKKIQQQQWEKETEMHATEEQLSYHHFLLDKAINLLPPQQQKVYMLSKHERLKYTEIASRMGISKETVKSYLKLATNTIISYVKKHSYLLLLALTRIKL
ncbi:RNA polymerase sigma-70 factor [Olivibacter ginsenosidimutans]|uniref:RNA polymerase sigma-70 factor n=1 Tax=Olivibacter ginsenosidimutans TaxID=1176537 RepID=A0ABP9AZ63_9SPHI